MPLPSPRESSHAVSLSAVHASTRRARRRLFTRIPDWSVHGWQRSVGVRCAAAQTFRRSRSGLRVRPAPSLPGSTSRMSQLAAVSGGLVRHLVSLPAYYQLRRAHTGSHLLRRTLNFTGCGALCISPAAAAPSIHCPCPNLHSRLYLALQHQLPLPPSAAACRYAQDNHQIATRLVRSQLPVLVAHSADDSVIPVDASDQMVQALADK